ncbi:MULTISPECIES: hypothetical protein [Thermoactinomyces]|jgi:hypothetical protein|nr:MULTISPECIES: hypothetical protein [Thermoactinomyces]
MDMDTLYQQMEQALLLHDLEWAYSILQAMKELKEEQNGAA